MERRIVLVRAVNVGGTAKLPMAVWRELAASLGASDVVTYIASGNMVCTVAGDPHTFDRALEQAVKERCGFFREVISRTRDEVCAALDAHSFEVVDPASSYVCFLSDEPAAEAIAAAHELRTGEDRWDVVGREMHLRYAHGAGRPQMSDVAIGRALGVSGTARNVRTVRKLIELSAPTTS